MTKVSSFNNLLHWVEECDNHNLSRSIPRIVVGNKCDQMTDQPSVSANAAQKFADQHNMPLFETSAKDDSHADHVSAIFLTLAHKLKNHKPMMPNKPNRVVLQKTVVETPNQNQVESDGGCC